MNDKKACPLCGELAYIQHDLWHGLVFYICPVCGRYQLKEFSKKIDLNKTASYIFYNRFLSHSNEYRYHTFRSKNDCDKFNSSFENGNNVEGRPVHIDNDLIDAWYPKTFSERIDYIIKYLGTHSKHIGQQVSFSYPEMLSLLFIDRLEMNNNEIDIKLVKRSKEVCREEAKYMLDSISDSGIINYVFGSEAEAAIYIRLTPKGYARVDELQKNTAHGKAALVAMDFKNTATLREAIRKGIASAGYVAVFIDEVQHNDFITPELLKHIRDSKFVVVDLTHQNNGAYFEEGYAMGLGKPVIQLCKHDTKLHFDIAQKNTIMWQTEDDIPERLYNRIRATID